MEDGRGSQAWKSSSKLYDVVEITCTVCLANFTKSFHLGEHYYVACSFNIMWAFFKLCRPNRPLIQVVPSSSEGQHACSRLSPSSPWLIVRGTDHLYPTLLHSLEASTWFGWCLFEFLRRCLQLVFYIQFYSDIFFSFLADRRATAPTTETLSHAVSRQTKGKVLANARRNGSNYQILLGASLRNCINPFLAVRRRFAHSSSRSSG